MDLTSMEREVRMGEEFKEQIADLKKIIEWEEEHIKGIRSSMEHVREHRYSLKKKGARFDPDRQIKSLEGQETSHLRKLSTLEKELAALEEELRALGCQDS